MVYSGMGYDLDTKRACTTGDQDQNLSVVLAAVSGDGINWVTGDSPIMVQPSQLGATGSGGASRPSLMWDVDHWRMWFDAPRPSDGALSLYHAVNYGDLLNPADWVLTQAWDSPQQVNVPNPDVVKVGDTYYCFADPAGYTPASSPIEGRQVGEYRSTDGMTWTWIDWVVPDADTPADQIPEAFVEEKDGTVWMYCWYAGTLPETHYVAPPNPNDPCSAPVGIEYTFDRIRYWRRLMDSAVAGNVAPLDLATNVGLEVTLEWAAANNPAPTSHNVYFGTSPTPPLVGSTTGTSYNVGSLSPNTTYHWRIDEVGATTYVGRTWSFTTGPSGAPQPAHDLYPADHAVQVHVDRDLKWQAGFGATSHDVYFGTSPTPPFVGNQPGTSYDPGTLVSATRYYWRIDEKNALGTKTGAVYSFVTRGGTCQADSAAGAVPDSYVPDLGTYVSGNMASLAADDGDEFVLASAGSGATGYHARAAFTFTNIVSDSPDCLKICLTIRSSISTMGYFVYLWNYTTSQWDQRYVATVGTADSSVEFTLASDFADYHGGGQLQIRTYGVSTGASFAMAHDVVKVVVPPLASSAHIPDSYSVDLGSYVSGNMSSLALDDGNDLVLASTTSGAGRHARAAFTFTNLASSSPSTITVSLTVRASIPNMTYAAYLWNHTTSQWDQKQLAAVGTTASSYEITLGSDAADYLRCGELKVRTYGAHGSTAFSMMHDVIKVTASPLDSGAGTVPASYAFDLGIPESGDMASLGMNDGDEFVLSGAGSAASGYHARADFTFTGISSSSPDCITAVLTVRSSIPDMTYAIYLWNYTIAQWVQKRVVVVGAVKSTYEVKLGSGSSDYLSGGQMQVRTYGAHGSTAFNLSHDVIKVIVP